MKKNARLGASCSVLALCVACCWVLWSASVRASHVQAVTATDSEAAKMQAGTLTGYADGKRWMIAPMNHDATYRLVVDTQRMFAESRWRLRTTDTENAPHGRLLVDSSPYRWWLASVALGARALTDQPIGVAVERAALWSGPLLHVLLLLGTFTFIGRHFGSWPAGVAALALAVMYPLAGLYLPGIAEARGLLGIAILGSILLLAAAGANPDHGRSLSLAAGVAGGLALWVSPIHATLVIVGIGLGGLAAILVPRAAGNLVRRPDEHRGRWRTWALSGAATCLGAYLIEFSPRDLELRLEMVHPLYGLAWLGLGESLELIEERRAHADRHRGASLWLRGALGLAVLAALPITWHCSEAPPLLFGDLGDSRIGQLPNDPSAGSAAAWLARDGLSMATLATFLPILIIAPALWGVFRLQGAWPARRALLVALGPFAVCAGVGLSQLWWWNLVAVTLVAVLILVTAELSAVPRSARFGAWLGLIACVLAPGIFLLSSSLPRETEGEFSEVEADALVDRALAHWLTDHASSPEAILLTPPGKATSWCFHSGLRSLGSAELANREGLAAAVRIASATTADEARALIEQRKITYLVLPSWDEDLDQLVQWSGVRLEDTFIGAIRRWAMPPWLRPIPYPLPAMAGWEDRRLIILEVTDEQNAAVALSRRAEYFLESQQLELAMSAARALERYPTDLSALVAIAHVAHGRGELVGHTKAVSSLLAALDGGAGRFLPWDRRVSLATVLAQAGHADLAGEQLRLCWTGLNPKRARSLTAASLYRLMVLGRRFNLPAPPPELHALCLKLLPAELRARLE